MPSTGATVSTRQVALTRQELQENLPSELVPSNKQQEEFLRTGTGLSYSSAYADPTNPPTFEEMAELQGKVNFPVVLPEGL